MKKFALSLLLFGALLMCACGGGKADSAQQDAEAERYDSLRTALAEARRQTPLWRRILGWINPFVFF